MFIVQFNSKKNNILYHCGFFSHFLTQHHSQKRHGFHKYWLLQNSYSWWIFHHLVMSFCIYFQSRNPDWIYKFWWLDWNFHFSQCAHSDLLGQRICWIILEDFWYHRFWLCHKDCHCLFSWDPLHSHRSNPIKRIRTFPKLWKLDRRRVFWIQVNLRNM